MTITTFPNLRIVLLQGLAQLKKDYDSNPQIFEEKHCPYDYDTITILKELFKAREIVQVVEKIVEKRTGDRGPREKGGLSAEDQQMVEGELIDILKNLKDMDITDTEGDADTRLKIMKAKATTIEQLIKLRERIYNLKRTSEFNAVVISILEDLMDEADRDEFLKRIEPYKE